MTSNTFTTQSTCRLSPEAQQRKVASFRPDLDMQEQAALRLGPNLEDAHQATSLKQPVETASSPDALNKNPQFVLMATVAEAFAFRAKVITKVHRCKKSSTTDQTNLTPKGAARLKATKTYFGTLMKDLEFLIDDAATTEQVATIQHCRNQIQELRMWECSEFLPE